MLFQGDPGQWGDPGHGGAQGSRGEPGRRGTVVRTYVETIVGRCVCLYCAQFISQPLSVGGAGISWTTGEDGLSGTSRTVWSKRGAWTPWTRFVTEVRLAGEVDKQQISILDYFYISDSGSQHSGDYGSVLSAARWY